jgi:hypothetical protein
MPDTALRVTYCETCCQKINPAGTRLTREGAPLLSVMRSSLRPCPAGRLLPANRQREKAPNNADCGRFSCLPQEPPRMLINGLRSVLVSRSRRPWIKGWAAPIGALQGRAAETISGRQVVSVRRSGILSRVKYLQKGVFCSALGRTRTCDLLIRSPFPSST